MVAQRKVGAGEAGRPERAPSLKDGSLCQPEATGRGLLRDWARSQPSSLLPDGLSGRLDAGAAGAAEAGVVLVAAELGLQDQITVGELGLVHTLPAEVPGVAGRRCGSNRGPGGGGKEAVDTEKSHLPFLCLKRKATVEAPGFPKAQSLCTLLTPLCSPRPRRRPHGTGRGPAASVQDRLLSLDSM